MKKIIRNLLLSIALGPGCGCFASLLAAPLTQDAPHANVCTGETIQASNTTWTLAPAAQCTGRIGFYVSNGSTDVIVGILSTSSTAPTEATTIRPFRLIAGTTHVFIPASDKLYFYVLSLGGGPQPVHIQAVKQI